MYNALRNYTTLSPEAAVCMVIALGAMLLLVLLLVAKGICEARRFRTLLLENPEQVVVVVRQHDTPSVDDDGACITDVELFASVKGAVEYRYAVGHRDVELKVRKLVGRGFKVVYRN